MEVALRDVPLVTLPSDTLPREHVERASLPWDAARLTECGRPVAEFAAVLSYDELVAKVRREGQQRAGLTTCITCYNTARNHATWEQSPSSVMARHCQRQAYRSSTSRIDVELRAIALLIEAHRDEFDETVEGLTGASSLDEVRARRRRRR